MRDDTKIVRFEVALNNKDIRHFISSMATYQIEMDELDHVEFNPFAMLVELIFINKNAKQEENESKE